MIALTAREGEALDDLRHHGRLFALHGGETCSWPRHGRGYSARTLDALVAAGLARVVTADAAPFYVPTSQRWPR